MAGKYAPTHAAEQYDEETGQVIGKETARYWLSAAGLWNSREGGKGAPAAAAAGAVRRPGAE